MCDKAKYPSTDYHQPKKKKNAKLKFKQGYKKISKNCKLQIPKDSACGNIFESNKANYLSLL